MEQLPDLSTLSHAEKDHIIHAIFDALVALRQDVAVLQAENSALQTEVQCDVLTAFLGVIIL
jgi:hypothetical protein